MSTDSLKLTLEDNFEDIIAKAQRGLGLTEDTVASQSGVKPDVLRSLRKGILDEGALAHLAPVLQLDGPSLVAIAQKKWYPHVPNLTGVVQISTAWKDFRVNAFVIWHPTTRQAVVFDTGTEPKPILNVVRENKLRVELILITHTHGDHVACLPELRKALDNPPTYVSAHGTLAGAQPIHEGTTFSLGPLHIEARRTSGHAPCGLTYVVRGLAHPVAVVGDALFAGSMGGPKSVEGWTEALQTDRAQIFTLPDDTVICPGHGPRTTVGQEKKHNPFFPEFK